MPRFEASASPVMDRLQRAFELVGRDIVLLPRQRYVVLNRNQTFGAIRESKRGLILGLYLPGSLVGDRLMDGAGFRLNRVTHQVMLRSPDDIDEEVVGWLRRAYQRG